MKVESEDDKVAWVNISNNEGDHAFSNGDDDFAEYNYDIGLDHFNEEQQKLFRLFQTENIGIDTKSANITYGAGRNG